MRLRKRWSRDHSVYESVCRNRINRSEICVRGEYLRCLFAYFCFTEFSTACH